VAWLSGVLQINLFAIYGRFLERFKKLNKQARQFNKLNRLRLFT